MASLREIRPGNTIVFKNEPWAVLKANHATRGRGHAILKIKIKNLVSGNIIDTTFQGEDTLEIADLDTRKAEYLYAGEGIFHFMDQTNFEQFSLSGKQLGDKINYLIEGSRIEILYFNGKPIDIDIPIKMSLKVSDAPPNIKGNTAQGGSKEVTTETGLKVTTPLFIEKGDKIKVDTRDGSYIERSND